MYLARALCVALVLVGVGACGPGSVAMDGDGGGSGSNFQGDPNGGTVKGTVWAPGNKPGSVPAGHEIPVAGATIWVSKVRPEPIPQEAYCDPCQAAGVGRIASDTKGHFEISGIAPGDYWLVIQKGQFRLEKQVAIGRRETLALPADYTTLPSEHDPSRGLWRPKIALAEGYWDDVEDILGKMLLGTVDGDHNFVGSSAAGNFDLYDNNDGYGSEDYDRYAVGTLNYLVSDVNRMKQYHIIFIPCSNGSNSQLFSNSQIRTNIKEYVKAGGKFYVTDWSAEWEDAVYPDFIHFGATPGSADHDTSLSEAMAGQFNQGDGMGIDQASYTSTAAQAVDQGLNAWLANQIGPQVITEGDYQDGAVNSNAFSVEGNWDLIDSLGTVNIGQVEGIPVQETPKVWVAGDWYEGEGPIHPLTVTFEPEGCGRVLYSTYHTADNPHSGLVPQERILLYLIMEIGVCRQTVVIE